MINYCKQIQLLAFVYVSLIMNSVLLVFSECVMGCYQFVS